jgi:predicted cation transporter
MLSDWFKRSCIGVALMTIFSWDLFVYYLPSPYDIRHLGGLGLVQLCINIFFVGIVLFFVWAREMFQGVY